MKYFKWILFSFCLILFSFLAYFVTQGKTVLFDDNVHFWVTSFANDYLTFFVRFITFFGSASFGILFVIIIFCFRPYYGKLMFLNFTGISLLSLILKYAFMRDRPSYMIINEVGFSFPSFHAMFSLAIYGFIIYLIWKKNFKYKKLICLFLILFILIIGLSRIYLGVHYATDILGGYLISFAYLILFTSFLKFR